MIRLILPLPPSVNTAYATVNKRRVKSRTYKLWLAQAESYLLSQWRTFTPIRGKYTARILLPEKMRGDVDGRIKLCLDALVKYGVTDDDKYCQKASAERDSTVGEYVCRVEIKAA